MKKKIITLVITGLIIFGYYLWDQYQKNQLMNELAEKDYVDRSEIAKLVVASYPSMDSYSTWDKTTIREAIDALSKLEVETTRNFKESDTYYKVKLSDDKNFQNLTYTFYDNNFVKKEDMVGPIGSIQYFKTEDTLFEDMFYPLLEAELNK